MNIIPKPLKTEAKSGFFTLNSATKLQITPNIPELQKIAVFFNQQIAKSTDLQIPIIEIEYPNNSIEFIISATDLGKEGYKLLIEPEKISLRAQAANGIFYGIQTLLQLLPVENPRELVLIEIDGSQAPGMASSDNHRTVHSYPQYKSKFTESLK